MKRFQECNWLVKLWRMRHYLYVPFKFTWYKITVRKSEFNNKTLWRLLIGMAQSDMCWYYTQDEVEKLFEKWK